MEPGTDFRVGDFTSFSLMIRLQQWTLCYLAYPLRRAGHGVVHAVVLADGSPQLCVRAVLLQRVGAFVPEVIVHGRVPHRAVVHVDLPRQVLERSGGRHREFDISYSSKPPVKLGTVAAEVKPASTLWRIKDLNGLRVVGGHRSSVQPLLFKPTNVNSLVFMMTAETWCVNAADAVWTPADDTCQLVWVYQWEVCVDLEDLVHWRLSLHCCCRFYFEWMSEWTGESTTTSHSSSFVSKQKTNVREFDKGKFVFHGL